MELFKETRKNSTYKMLPSVADKLKTKSDEVNTSQAKMIETALEKFWNDPHIIESLKIQIENSKKLIEAQHLEIEGYIRAGMKKKKRPKRITVTLSDNEFEEINQAAIKKQISKTTAMRERLFGLIHSKKTDEMQLPQS